ncbi:MAG: rRNA maturation RNase YbeY [Wenzhouxiangellaceae bacterium]
MDIEIQRACDAQDAPDDQRLRDFACMALEGLRAPVVCLRIVDEQEMAELNGRWRQRAYATNVLSFPGAIPPGLPDEECPDLLGDVVLCAPVIAAEAQAQRKPLEAHWAHMIIHGLLHLRGHDHIQQDDAEVMEALERRLLAALGFPDPYADPADHPSQPTWLQRGDERRS